MDNEKVGSCVIPGDIVGRFESDVKIGSGLMQENSVIIATKAGVLQFREPNKFWVENSQRRVCFSIIF